ISYLPYPHTPQSSYSASQHLYQPQPHSPQPHQLPETYYHILLKSLSIMDSNGNNCS
ncbi:hypothetical protein M422DRAFT_30331, partial [Sphaerobolus stellatus SS14]